MGFNLNKDGRLERKAMSAQTLLPLELMDAGEWAEVAEVTGEPGWISRLAELGVRVGSRCRVLQPGSPCLLQIGGSRLSLRGELAVQILVSPVAAGS